MIFAKNLLMSFAAKLIFLAVILLVGTIPVVGMQDPNVAWYEEFFENNKRQVCRRNAQTKDFQSESGY